MVSLRSRTGDTRQRLSVIVCLLLLRTTTQTLPQVQGSRVTVRLMQVGKGSGTAEEDKVLVATRARIGSTPPSCRRRCLGCGRCEAVQVPVLNKATHVKEASSNGYSSSSWVTAAATATSRGDDGGTSNYKPLSWKCKCGNMVFDP